MKIVSIINYKGGVGKTTLTSNLGAQLAWTGKRVLILDLDAQASLTFSFIKPDAWDSQFSSSKTIKSWFDSFEEGPLISLKSLIEEPSMVKSYLGTRGKLDVIYSHLGLINVDLDLATKLAGATIGQAKRNFLNVHRRLAEGFARDFATSQYDIVLIDCPPNFNIVTKTALIASDYLLVPARPDHLSTLGIEYLIRSVRQLVKDYNDYAGVQEGTKTPLIDPMVLGVVFTMIQEYGQKPISAQRPFINQVRKLPGLDVFKNYIRRNDTLFASAAQFGVPVVLQGYNSGSHKSVVEGLEAVCDEFTSAVGI